MEVKEGFNLTQCDRVETWDNSHSTYCIVESKYLDRLER